MCLALPSLEHCHISTVHRNSSLTCKCVMSLSMFSGEVTQLSGMYLKFSGHGSLSTPLTQVIGTASYPREMSLREGQIMILKYESYMCGKKIFNICSLSNILSRNYKFQIFFSREREQQGE